MKRTIHRVIVICSIFILFIYTANGQRSSSIKKNRDMLKEYFLYSCIRYGFESKNISDIDHSGAVYIDLLRYDLKAINITDSLAKNFINSIESSNYEGHNTKGIIILSIEKYKSNELDKFIKSMDKYMIKQDK
ncbi:MAG: hypothetical protein ACOYO1_11360 [Bacteroidales bacterium]